MRSTRAHTGNRRSHHGLGEPRFSICQDCGSRHTSHRVCTVCGKYNGRVVIDVAKKLAKAEKKRKAKATA
ncbi:MAG: 50S ribosomal protein L32 [bacterium]|nr:50S ribosomal protein L32 [bacterium]